MDKPKKLTLRKSTVRKLTLPELRTVHGADEVEPVTRGFTGCEYCGDTNSPKACRPSYQGDCDDTYWDCVPDGTIDPIDPHCVTNMTC